mmetsp:Transcript_39313/g.108444  ORF Transcript_39313/g.108444 Transcript_39313/m.108444 type:complete len:211 (-) Transcript_39313:141-773(-)
MLHPFVFDAVVLDTLREIVSLFFQSKHLHILVAVPVHGLVHTPAQLEDLGLGVDVGLRRIAVHLPQLVKLVPCSGHLLAELPAAILKLHVVFALPLERGSKRCRAAVSKAQGVSRGLTGGVLGDLIAEISDLRLRVPDRLECGERGVADAPELGRDVLLRHRWVWQWNPGGHRMRDFPREGFPLLYEVLQVFLFRVPRPREGSPIGGALL